MWCSVLLSEHHQNDSILFIVGRVATIIGFYNSHLSAKDFSQKITIATSRLYVPTDFDTIEKAFSGVKTAEKCTKQGLSRSNADFGSPCFVCSIGVQMPGIIVDCTPCGVLILQ